MSAGAYGWQTDGGTRGMEPSMRGNLRLEGLLGGAVYGALDARVRRDFVHRVGQTRLYAGWLGWRLPDSTLEVETGRLGNRGFGGVGFIDGLRGNYRVAQHLQLSLFGGWEPDLRTFGLGKTTSKMGVEFALGQPIHRWYGAGSLLEQRYENKLDRRLFTYRGGWMPRPNYYLFHSLETDFVWRENGSNHSGVRISSVQISMNHPLTEKLRWSESFRYRRNVLVLRSMRAVSDTLFEQDPTYDFGLSCGYRMARSAHLRSDVRWQVREQDRRKAFSAGMGVTYLTPTTVPWYLSIEMRLNDNLYYKGLSSTASIEREIYRRLNVTLLWGTESSTYHSIDGYPATSFVRQHTDVGLSYWISNWSIGSGVEFWNTEYGQEIRYRLDSSYKLPILQKNR